MDGSDWLRPRTMMETDEDVRSVLAPIAVPPRAANAFRPRLRPPVALLTVCDDGRADGEVIRLRDVSFVIGRTEGDLKLPHDGLISTRHVEITRQVVGGVVRWVLTDLQSTNGLFIRVSRTTLVDRTEILVGGGRYRFDHPRPDDCGTVDHLPGDPVPTGLTKGYPDVAPAARPPALTELLGPNSIGNRLLLTRDEYWIGSDPACAIVRPDDPYCEPRQVRVHQTARGGWMAEHPKTLNGLWYRVPQIVVEKTLQFQIGEQRFKLKI